MCYGRSYFYTCACTAYDDKEEPEKPLTWPYQDSSITSVE